MMIKIARVFLLLVVSSLMSYCSCIRADTLAEDTYINVLEFVRKVGNETDHTEAIRQAFDSARVREPGMGWRTKTVFFPPGNYRISDTITIAGGLIKGNNASIHQQDPEKDIFRSTHFPHLHINGLNFLGGRHQIWLGEYEGGQAITITDCNFANSTGWAIYIDTNMCVVNIERGNMRRNAGLIYVATDSVVMRDLFVVPAPNAEYPASFDLRCAFSIMENCLLNPGGSYGDSQWIANHSNHLIVRDVRFSGERGGYTPIVNYRKYTDTTPMTISIENSWLLNQGNLNRPGAVYCVEVPNRILIRNSWLTNTPAITVSDSIDLKEYFFESRSRLELEYIVESTSIVREEIPELLRNPLIINKFEQEEHLAAVEAETYMEKAVAGLKDLRATVSDSEPSTTLIIGTEREHTEQTEPAKYVEAPVSNYIITGYADGTTVPNKEFFSVRSVDNDLIILPLRYGTGSAWVLLEGFTVDVDRYPILTRKVLSRSSYDRIGDMDLPIRHGTYRIIDRETGESAIIWNIYNRYSAIDLRRQFGSGTRTFDIRIYASLGFRIPVRHLPEGFRMPPEITNWNQSELALTGTPPLGTYKILDYIRAEMEN